MGIDSETAARYRVHAEELRVIAADANSENIRFALLTIAEDYDRMAASLEAIDQTNKRFTKPEEG